MSNTRTACTRTLSSRRMLDDVAEIASCHCRRQHPRLACRIDGIPTKHAVDLQGLLNGAVHPAPPQRRPFSSSRRDQISGRPKTARRPIRLTRPAQRNPARAPSRELHRARLGPQTATRPGAETNKRLQAAARCDPVIDLQHEEPEPVRPRMFSILLKARHLRKALRALRRAENAGKRSEATLHAEQSGAPQFT